MTQTPNVPAITITMQGDWEVTTTENTLVIRFRDVTPAAIEPTLNPQNEPAIEPNVTTYLPAPGIKAIIDQWLKATFVIDSQNRDEHVINDLADEFAQYRRNHNDPTAYNPRTIRAIIGKWAADRPTVYTRQIQNGEQNRSRVLIGLRRRKIPTKPNASVNPANRIDFNP